MVDCDYCSEAFEDEDGYLSHLAAEHEGELGSIDKRRVAQHTSDDGDGFPVVLVAVGVVVALGAALAVYLTVSSDGPAVSGIEGQSLDERGDSDLLTDVESFPNQGNEHVQRGTDVQYAQMPPLSGPHYTGTVDAGFYAEEQALGDLVHTLEHGAVIVYYDPAALTNESEESLETFASIHTGTWRSVVVVPNPTDDPEADYVLTAWRHRLYVDQYDAETVHAFLSEYLGRGPENPVR
ncbi:DUF3105 domain-containing protein [Halomicroarcula sp. GCM10025324]|uniref:DUF3105 domain-containing protein n=1 Tax=Haloarcula TaxID=2237 RepID=UPI0023E8BDD3|nr:DUF3105 domain-containing protein [Halomicroarcula sp. ZS-22-S1]